MTERAMIYFSLCPAKFISETSNFLEKNNVHFQAKGAHKVVEWR